MNTDITLTREVEAIQIPSGDTIILPAGTRVIITQSLGGSYLERLIAFGRLTLNLQRGCFA